MGFKSHKKKNRIFLNVKKIFLVVGFLSILSVGCLVLVSKLFIISQVKVQRDQVGCVSDDQIKIDSQALGKNTFFLNEDQINTNLLSHFFCIGQVNIYKNFPNTITIQALGRTPLAMLVHSDKLQATSSAALSDILADEASSGAKIESSDKVIDQQGMVFEYLGDTSVLPVIWLQEEELKIGTNLSAKGIDKVLKILVKLKEINVLAKEVKIYSPQTLLIASQPKIIFDLQSNIDVQLASLQLILDKAKIDQESIEAIDLRYENPVVKYASKRKS